MTIKELEEELLILESQTFGTNDYQIAMSNQNIGKIALLKELIEKEKARDYINNNLVISAGGEPLYK